REPRAELWRPFPAVRRVFRCVGAFSSVFGVFSTTSGPAKCSREAREPRAELWRHFPAVRRVFRCVCAFSCGFGAFSTSYVPAKCSREAREPRAKLWRLFPAVRPFFLSNWYLLCMTDTESRLTITKLKRSTSDVLRKLHIFF